MGEDATLIQFDLVNSTYTTTFNFVHGSQHLDVDVDKLEGDVDVVKTVQWSHVPNDCLQSENDRFNNSNCTFDHGVLWRLSYQSIMYAFSSLSTGQVTANAGYAARNLNTSVTLTSLIDTEEFGFLNEDNLRTGLSSNLQDLVADVNAPETLGIIYPNEISVSANQRHYPPLHQNLEELFQNVTLSLTSSLELWANETPMTAPPPVMVTVPSSVPTYVYAREKLWLTYGIAIAISCASTVFGTVVMVMTGRSYDCNFSTILRTTRHAELDAEVAAPDTAGTAPLLKYLAETRIHFARYGTEDDDADGGDVEMASLPTQEPLLPLSVPIEGTENGSVSSGHNNGNSHSSSVSTVTIENLHDLPEDSINVPTEEHRAEEHNNSDVSTRPSE